MTLIPILFAYFVMAGVTFRVVANTTNYPEDPWVTPGPFFAGLLWFATLPLFIGKALAEKAVGVGPRLPRDERRRAKEIKEAEHKRDLARIDAQTTAELERSLR